MKKMAIEVKDATVQAVNNASDFPTTMHCSNIKCGVVLAIPENAFDWKCPQGHTNVKTAKVCADCQQPKPKNLPEPKIRCAKCETISSVPFSNLVKDMRYAAQQAQKEYEFAKARPEQFHCSHCNSMLQTPKGPWTCQTCRTPGNPEEAAACSNCGQKQSEQKVLCGICNRSTKIPSMNVIDQIQSTSRDVAKQSEKVYYDLRGHAYVKCPTCTKPLQIPTEDKNQAGISEGALPQEGEGVGLLAEGKEKLISCPKCGAEVSYVKPSEGATATAAQNEGTAGDVVGETGAQAATTSGSVGTSAQDTSDLGNGD